jgi:hypothetical protein
LSEQLERALNTTPIRPGRPARYEVVNAGIGGFGPAEEYLWIKHEAFKLDPDLLIVQIYLGNDISDAGCKILGQDKHKHKVCFYFDKQGQIFQDELLPRDSPPDEAIRRPLRNTSLLFNVLETGVFEKLEGDGPAADWKSNMGVYARPRTLPRRKEEEWEEAWRISEWMYASIKREADIAGVPLLMTAAPSVYQVYTEEWQEVLRQNRLEPEEWDVELPNRRLAEIAARHGIGLCDLAPAFRQEVAAGAPRLFYHYDRHFTPAGHEVAARHLQAHLEARRLLP